MSFFGSDAGGDAGSSGIGTPAAPDYSGDTAASANAAQLAAPPNPNADVGKFNIDLTDIGGSVEGALSGGLGLASGLVGGAAGLVGGLGVGGGTVGGAVANAAGAVGQVAGAVGSVPLPFVRNQFTPAGAQAATVGDIPGEVGKIIGLPGQAVQRYAAGQRVLNDQANLPPDIEMKLQSGQLTVDQAADQLVAQGQGFTNARATNLLASIVLDPTNYIGLGVGKLGALAGDAGIAVKAAQVGDDLGIGQRIVGTAYNALTRGLPGAASATTDALLGSATNGVVRSLGADTVNGIIGSANKLAPAYGQAVEDGLGVGISNITKAAMADYLTSRNSSVVADLLSKPSEFNDAIAATASQLQAVNPDRFTRIVDNYMDRVKGQFYGMTPDAIKSQTAQLLSTTTGMSVDEAMQTLPKVVDVNTAATVRASAFGSFASDLDAAKTASMGAVTDFGSGRTVADLTGIAPDTLTQQRAADLLKATERQPVEGAAPGLSKGGRQLRPAMESPATAKADVGAAVERYDVLRQRFSGQSYTVKDVREYVKGINDALPAQLVPTTGAHALPEAITAVRSKWADAGYDIGFAPKDGLHMLRTADGDLIPTTPFIPMVSDKSPVAVRNPLGQAMEGMLRGVDQTKIIAAAKARLMTYSTIDHQLLTPREAKSIFGRLLDAAVDNNRPVRGGKHGEYDTLFREVLGDTRYAQFREAGGNPTFLVNHAFQNETRNVGATQALTGWAKTQTSSVADNALAHLSERIYQGVRFSLSPLFQVQNLIETPIMSALRGIRPWSVLAKDGRPLGVDPEAAALFGKLSQSSRDVRTLLEQGITTGLAGHAVADKMVSDPTLLGRVFGHLPSVRGWKDRGQLAQIVKEHPEAFKTTLAKMQPDLVRIMQDAYGTKDWSKIGVAWARERLTMAEDPARATSIFRSVRPVPHGADAVTIDNAFQYALELSSRASKQTQFFQPERSWLLRTINHPFLGLYPASYMWGHVLPEFSRFLLLRPFGLRAPLAGAAALMNVQREMAAEFADPSSDIGKWVADHPEAIYILNQLLPGDPTSLGANAPLAVRHAINGKLTPTAVAQNPQNALGLNFGAFRDISASANILNEFTKAPKRAQPQSLSELLDQSAQQYNTWVLPSLQRSVAAADQAVMENLSGNR